MKRRLISVLCAALVLLGGLPAYAAPADAVQTTEQAVTQDVQPRAVVQVACSLTKYDSKQMKLYASAVANNESVGARIYATLERYNGVQWVGVSTYEQSGKGEVFLQKYVSPAKGYRYRARVNFFTDAGDYTMYSSEVQW